MKCLVRFGIIAYDIDLIFNTINRKFASRDKTYSDRFPFTLELHVSYLYNLEKLLWRCFNIVWNNSHVNFFSFFLRIRN